MRAARLPLLLASTPSVAAEGRVVLPVDVLQRLISDEAPDASPAPGPHALRRELSLQRTPEGLSGIARWWVIAPEAGELRVAGAAVDAGELRFEGALGGDRREDGLWLPLPAGSAGIIELPFTLRGNPEREQVWMELLPAATGGVRVHAGPLAAELTAGDGRALVPHPGGTAASTGAGRIGLRLAAPAARDEGPAAALWASAVGIGLTVGDAAVGLRARVRVEALRGDLDVIELRVHGMGDDLEITAAPDLRVTRDGDRLQLARARPSAAPIEVELAGSSALPSGDAVPLALPRIEVQGAFRATSTLQLSRDEGVELVPALAGWTATPAWELPAWGQGLTTGLPVSTWTRAAGPAEGAVTALRFLPASGPPVLVDVASATVAPTAEGRALVRVRYTVRNERGAALVVGLQPGQTLLGVTVSGEAVAPAPTAAGLRVPVPRSLETVGGLVSFPVDLLLLVEGEPWRRRRASVELRLPSVDAPIAVAQTTVHLPRGARAARRAPPGVVPAFSEGEGLAYGYGAGVSEARADQLWQAAMASYLRNDFDDARAQIDALDALGASNANTVRLQSNLELFGGGGGGGGAAAGGDAQAEALARRVKAQARARGAEQAQAWKQQVEEAERLEISGDVEGSLRKMEEAVVLGETLVLLEGDGVEQRALQSSLSRRYSAAVETAAAAGASGAVDPLDLDAGVVEPAADRRGARGGEGAAPTAGFAELQISGDTLTPDGAYVQAPGDESSSVTHGGIAYKLDPGPPGLSGDALAAQAPAGGPPAGPGAPDDRELPAPFERELGVDDADELAGVVDGVQGGVVGGVLGGVMGAVFSGAAAGPPDAPAPEPTEFEDSAPQRLVLRTSTSVAPAGRPDARPAPPKDAPARVLQRDRFENRPAPAAPAAVPEPALPEVRAAGLDLLLPPVGDPVLHQALLVPAGAALPLSIPVIRKNP